MNNSKMHIDNKSYHDMGQVAKPDWKETLCKLKAKDVVGC